jgi:hypothetical protein
MVLKIKEQFMYFSRKMNDHDYKYDEYFITFYHPHGIPECISVRTEGFRQNEYYNITILPYDYMKQLYETLKYEYNRRDNDYNKYRLLFIYDTKKTYTIIKLLTIEDTPLINCTPEEALAQAEIEEAEKLKNSIFTKLNPINAIKRALVRMNSK